MAKLRILFFSVVLLLCGRMQATQANEVIEKQLRALGVVFMELETHYGMTKYKEEQFGISLDKVKEKYEKLIREARSLSEDLGLTAPVKREQLSTEEFEQLLIGLASEFRDGHLNILRLFSTNYWTTGIYASAIDYHLYVTGLDPELFAKGLSSIEPKVGDEIISVNGVSVHEIAKQLEPYTQLATHQSRMNFAYQLILNRPHYWLPSINEKQPLEIQFRRINEDDEPINFSATYNWINHKSLTRSKYLAPHQIPIPENQKYFYGFSRTKTYFSEGLRAIEDDINVLDLAAAFNADIERAHELYEDDEEARFQNKSTLFPLNKKELESLTSLEPRNTIPVYIIRHRGQNIAVIRMKDYELEIEDMEWLIFLMKRLNQMSDVLIIDQLSNAGGSSFIGSEFIRLFANETALKSTSIDLRLSNALVHSMETWNQQAEEQAKKRKQKKEKKKKNRDTAIETDEDLVENEKILETYPERSFARLLLDQQRIDELRKKLEVGESYSGPVSDFSSQVENAEGRPGLIAGREGYVYQKPILVLNDCQSGSCGDFIPAVLQANKRALIFGETSMGLGGPVYRDIDFLPGSQMYMRCTNGFCLRSDGLPIENIGVVPDISRWLKHSDLLDGFKSYSENVLDVAIDLAEGTSVEKIRKAHRKALSDPEPRTAAYISFRKIYNDLEKKISNPKLSVEANMAAYQDFFLKLENPKFSGIGKSHRKHLSIPLPSALLQRDIILSSLRKANEIEDRLKQLAHLDQFSEYKRLIQYLISKIQYFEHESRLSCSESLSHFVKQD